MEVWGLTSLLAAFPVGYAVDQHDRTLILKVTLHSARGESSF